MKKDQERVETVLIAAVWKDQDSTDATALAAALGVNPQAVEKAKKMAQDEVLASAREIRGDSVVVVAFKHVNGVSHDPTVSRANTSSKTARNFCTFIDFIGKEQEHFIRTWTCLTGDEKHERFKDSKWNEDLNKELSELGHRCSMEAVKAETRVRSKVDSGLKRCLKKSEMVEFLNRKCDNVEEEECSQDNSFVERVMASHSSICDIGLPVVTPEEKSNHGALGFKASQALLCPCCRNPRFKDCVDPILTLVQIMPRALLDAIGNNKEVKAEFESCVCVKCEQNTCETHTTFRDRLKHDFYAIIESTCCNRKPCKDLQIDGDPTPPRMIPRECTDPSLPTCQQCGVKKKLHDPLNCPVWKERGIPIDIVCIKLSCCPWFSHQMEPQEALGRWIPCWCSSADTSTCSKRRLRSRMARSQMTVSTCRRSLRSQTAGS
jgi:hypothetical protein